MKSLAVPGVEISHHTAVRRINEGEKNALTDDTLTDA